MRKNLIISLAAVLIIVVSGQIANCQEVRIPFFPEQNIEIIDKGYAKRMSLFREYPGFIEAKMFLTNENQYAVEVFYEKNDSVYKDRMVLGFEEKEAYLRELVSQFARQTINEPQDSTVEIQMLNQRGRSAMLVMNTITGLGFYGPALPLTLNVEETKAFVGLYMLSAGASFYIPYRTTMDKDVTLGQASFTFYGQSRGIGHGMLLGEILAKDVNYDDYFPEGSPYSDAAYDRYDRARDRKNQFLFGMGMVGSISEGIAGFQLARKWEYTGGSTSIFQMWGDVGTISGILLAEPLGFWDRPSLNATFGTILATSAAGMVAGKYFGDSRNYTLGDAIVYRSTILLSCFAPVTLVHYFEPEEFTPYAVAGLAGIAAGSYFGWKSTLNRDFDTSDGVFIALGELAGGLVGLGLGYLIAPEDSDGKVILTSATLGAFGGYGLMYSQLNKRALTLNSDVNLDVSLNPAGLLMSSSKFLNPAFSPSLNPNNNPAFGSAFSLVNARLTF